MLLVGTIQEEGRRRIFRGVPMIWRKTEVRLGGEAGSEGGTVLYAYRREEC